MRPTQDEDIAKIQRQLDAEHERRWRFRSAPFIEKLLGNRSLRAQIEAAEAVAEMAEVKIGRLQDEIIALKAENASLRRRLQEMRERRAPGAA